MKYKLIILSLLLAGCRGKQQTESKPPQVVIVPDTVSLSMSNVHHIRITPETIHKFLHPDTVFIHDTVWVKRGTIKK